MAIELEIKTDLNYKEKIDLNEIVNEKIHIGVWDNFGRLILKEANTNESQLVFFDENSMGRGIEITFGENNISMRLSLPTVRREIDLFYEIARKFKNKLNIMDYSDIDNDIISKQHETNKIMLNTTLDYAENKFECVSLQCVTNPIYLGKDDALAINKSLEAFEVYLHNRQYRFFYYSTVQLQQTKDSSYIFGIFSLPPDVWTIIPRLINPKFYDNKITVDDLYVFLGQTIDEIIPYRKLVEDPDIKLQYYDYRNALVKVSSEKAKELIEKHRVDLLNIKGKNKEQ